MPRSLDPFAPAGNRKSAAAIPYEFVLDQLSSLPISTRPMFGSLAVYVEDRVLCILREKGDADDGVWLSFESQHEAEVMQLLPRLARITVLPNVRSWRKLAASDAHFEDDAMLMCRLVREGDMRLGKVPDRQKKKSAKPQKSASAKSESEASRKKTAAKKSSAKPAKAKPKLAKSR